MIDLPETAVREKISLALYRGNDAPDGMENAAMVRYLEKLGIGMTVVALGDVATDRLYRCEHYALGTVLGETWAQPGQKLPERLRARTGSIDDFLTNHEYRLTRRPGAGSLAVYLAGVRGSYGHMGIVMSNRPNRRIESKFGGGPVMAHDEDHVPISYGHTLIFYKPPRRAREAYRAHAQTHQQP
jgi:hypothetical protein